VGEGEGEMTANVLPRIFTIEIGDTPTLTFEVQNLREAQELCHEQWLISVLRPKAKLFRLRCLMIIGTEGGINRADDF
jgi:hypothetical protein